MTHRPLVQRVVGVVGAGGLALATLVLAAPPASAAVFSGQAYAFTDFSTSGGSTCTLSADTGSTQTLPVASDGAPVSFAFAGSAVATDDPADLADTTQLGATIQASMAATEAAGALTGFDLEAAGTLKVDRAQDTLSSCDSSATAGGYLVSSAPIVVSTPATLDLTVNIRGDAATSLTFYLIKSDAPAGQSIQLDINIRQTTHRLVALPAGQYALQVMAQSSLEQAPSDPVQENATFDYAVHGDVVAPGSASSAQKGTGNKYLRLGSAVSCGTDSLTADFLKAAGKKPKKGKKSVISKATFYVDDVKVKTVRKPHKNTLTTLTGIPDDVVTVEVVLKVRGKGAFAVRRTYRPCF